MLFHAPFVLGLLLQSQPAPTPPPATALIVGRVVDAGTGGPVAGAILQVSGSSLPPTPGSPPPRVMTTAQGQFVIRGLQKGAVNLNVSKPGYLMASSGQLRPRGPSRPVTIESDDAHVTDVVLRMWKFGSISGTVVDESGEPVPGVGVQAFDRNYFGGQARFVPSGSALTDDRGIYTIDNLVPGDYVVGAVSTTSAVPTGTLERVTSQMAPMAPPPEDLRLLFTTGVSLAKAGTPYAIGVDNFSVSETSPSGPGSVPILQPDGSLLVYPSVFYPSAAHFRDATGIAIRSGEDRTGIDIALHPARGVRVSGTIVGPDGPAANLGVHVAPAGDDETVMPIDTSTALTDANGGFTLFGVPEGQYTLRVTHVPSSPSPAPETTTIMSSGSMGGMISTSFASGAPLAGPVPTAPTLSANAPVAVGNTNITGLVVPLKSGGRITGHLEFDGTADKPTGNALVNIRMLAQSADGSRADRFGPVALGGHADETGAFTTVGVLPGRYVLQVIGMRPPWVVRSAMYRGQDLLDSPVAIDTGDISGVVITLTDRDQKIRGTVRAGQTPDPNATVFLFPADTTNATAAGPGPRRFRGIRSGVDGSYTFNGVPPGDYDIVAVTNDPGEGWQNPQVLASLAALATPIQIADGDSKTQDLTSVAIK